MKVKALLDENLKPMISDKNFNSCWKIVDLGCSSGPNALMAVSNIMNVIDKISLSLNHGLPVFQIYLNDLFENDFNTIFKLLPHFHQSIQKERGDNASQMQHWEVFMEDCFRMIISTFFILPILFIGYHK
jgi:jasmonate O-methyltransferase